jgi:glycosyltransferase involved in cell wall biosynthesis
LFEGFGFPILEAMACDVPVVCSRASCLPEVAGDAALLVDPQDEADLAGAMARVLHDEVLRTELVERGRVRASGGRNVTRRVVPSPGRRFPRLTECLRRALPVRRCG